jgi:hypothetical protein
MASDLRGYTADETLNKVLNTSNDSIQVDIVDATGVTITSTNDSVYVDDANWTDSTSSHTLVGGIYQSTPQSITDGDTGPLQVNANGNLIVDLSATDNAVLDAMVVDLAALEVLSTAANVDHAANEALLITIDADTNDIKTAVQLLDNAVDGNYLNTNINLAGSDAPTGGGTESGVLRVTIANNSTGVLSVDDGGGALTVDGTVTANLGTTDNAVLDAIAASLSVLDDWDDSNFANVNMNLAGSDAQAAEGTISATTQRVTIATDDDGVAHLATIAGAVSTQMQVDIVADGAGLATDANLALMLYGTALVVTAVHAGSDHVLGATYEAFYIGVGGDVSLDCVTSGTNIVFKNLASGQMLPVRATVVNATNTTATNIVALKA